MLRSEINGLSVAWFKGDFTMIAWDAPGAGQSSDPPETFVIDDWADCLAGLLDVARIDRAHVLGLSWGGLVAQVFYRRYPGRAWSLVLADTYAGWRGSLPDPVSEERLAACVEDASRPAGDLVPRYLPGMHSTSATQGVRKELARILADFHPVGFRLMAMSLAHSDTRDLLPNIQVPTLLVWGDADERSPMTVARQLHDSIPGARLAIIPGAGHLSNVEAPARFNAEVRDFCLSVSVT